MVDNGSGNWCKFFGPVGVCVDFWLACCVGNKIWFMSFYLKIESWGRSSVSAPGPISIRMRYRTSRSFRSVSL